MFGNASRLVDEICDLRKRHTTTFFEWQEKLKNYIPITKQTTEDARLQLRLKMASKYARVRRNEDLSDSKPCVTAAGTATKSAKSKDSFKRRHSQAIADSTPPTPRAMKTHFRKQENEKKDKSTVHQDDVLLQRRRSFEIIFCYSDYKNAMECPSATWVAASPSELHFKHTDQLASLLSDDPFAHESLLRKKQLLQYIRGESEMKTTSQQSSCKLWKRFKRLDSIEKLEQEDISNDCSANAITFKTTEKNTTQHDTRTNLKTPASRTILKPQVATIDENEEHQIQATHRRVEAGHFLKERHVSWPTAFVVKKDAHVANTGNLDRPLRRKSTSEMIALTLFDVCRQIPHNSPSYWVGTEITYCPKKSAIVVTIRQLGSQVHLLKYGSLSKLHLSARISHGKYDDQVVCLKTSASKRSSQSPKVLQFKVSPDFSELRVMSADFSVFQKNINGRQVVKSWTMSLLNNNGDLTNQEWKNIVVED